MTVTHAPSPYRWAWYLPGLLAVGWGAYGLVTAGPSLPSYVVFFGLGIAAHDLVLAPVAIAVGWLVARCAPGVVRMPVQVALFGSGVVILAAFPYLTGIGVAADVPSALPFDYRARVAVLIAVIWVAAVLWALFRLVRSRRTAPVDHPVDGPGPVAAPG